MPLQAVLQQHPEHQHPKNLRPLLLLLRHPVQTVTHTLQEEWIYC
jgi:hypothetical protein